MSIFVVGHQRGIADCMRAFASHLRKCMPSHRMPSFPITSLFIGWNGLSPSPQCELWGGGAGVGWGMGVGWGGWGTNEMGDQWEQGRKGYAGGLIRWGANENCVPGVALGDQWDGGPMGAVYPGLRWGTNGMGDQWELCTQGCVGGPMTWGTNENRLERVTMGGQWDGGPMRNVYPELHWGTSEMGDQWDNENCVPRVGGPMSRETNKMGDQWIGWYGC